MKWSAVLLGITSFVAVVSARSRPFHLKVQNSPNTYLNGLYLGALNGAATFGEGIEPITAYFDDTPPFVLYASGPGIEGDVDNFFLSPTGSTSGVYTLNLADFAISEAKYTEFHILNDYLTYGSETDKFFAFPSSAADGRWVIRWIPDDVFTTANGFSIDLFAEFI